MKWHLQCVGHSQVCRIHLTSAVFIFVTVPCSFPWYILPEFFFPFYVLSVWRLSWDNTKAMWILSPMSGISYYLGHRLMLFNSWANFSSYLILVPFITSKNFPSNCRSENQTHLFFHFLSAERIALQFSPPLRFWPFSYHLNRHHARSTYSETFDSYKCACIQIRKCWLFNIVAHLQDF